ncbi:MAG: hypothetical protein NTZ05_08265 [Chloroflexi bacterium]|nr:hypothetical protein [Chloroflexota bacterium]
MQQHPLDASNAFGVVRPLLVLIDGHALARRAYHGMSDSTRGRQGIVMTVGSTGEAVQAVYGFTSMLLKVLNERRPNYLIVAFDAPARTFRHEQFDGYKAQRAAAPPDFHQQLARIRGVLDAFSIPQQDLPGWEADDILGTLSRQADAAGVDTIIVTGDGDTMQLVGPGVRVLYPGRSLTDATLFDEQAVVEKYGVEPARIADLKGLKGDASDNIPGVPGVGDKTALKLLEEFGTVEGVLENVALIKPARLQQLVETNAAMARQSKQLATIDCDAPITLDLEPARFGRFDREAVLKALRDLEFNSLVARIPRLDRAEGAVPTPTVHPAGSPQLAMLDMGAPASAPQEPVRYEVVTTPEALAELRDRLNTPTGFSFDTETTSQHEMEARLVGLSFAVQPYEAFYLPVGHLDGSPQLGLEEVQDALRPVLADPSVPKVGHNAKYDMIVLANHGMPVQGLAGDSMIAAYLLGEKAIGLKDLAFRRLAVEMTPISDLIGKGGAN